MTWLPKSHFFLTPCQKPEQRVIQRLGRIEQRVIDTNLRESLLQCVHVGAYERDVLLSHRFRHHGYLVAAFEVLEGGCIGKAEIELRRVQHVKHDQIIATKPQRGHSIDHGLRIFVEI